MVNDRKKELVRCISSVIDSLSQSGIRYECDVDMSSLSYFKSGGIARIIVSPANQDQLIQSVQILNQSKVGYKVVGETSNLLFLDDEDYTCLLSTVGMTGLYYDENTEQIVSEPGAMLPELSRKALYQSFTGFEGLEGIPGTVGGAVFMNAGAYGYDIKGVLKSVDVVSPDGFIKNYSVTQLELNYRNSVFKAGKIQGVISNCYFSGSHADQSEISTRMELFHAKRHKYQEFNYPNLGSLFSGSIYRSFGKRDRLYNIVASVYYLLNYKLKIFRRESPMNRKWLNDYTVKRFGFEYENQPFSDKTMNTIINNGHHTDEVLAYIEQVKKLVGEEVPIENEIVGKF